MGETRITSENYHDHQVRDGKLQLVTASSIKMFMRCPLQWYRETILGQKRPDTPAIDLGRQVHKAIETAIKTGRESIQPTAYVDNPVWESAQKALQFLGWWGDSEVAIQGEITIAGVPVWGKIDLIQTDALYDWKTISTVAKRPSRSSLNTDPQKVLYSRWHHLSSHLIVSFTFVYLSKTIPAFQMVKFDGIADDIKPFTDIVESMKLVASYEFDPPCRCGTCLQESKMMTKTTQAKTLVIPIEPPISGQSGGLELWIDCLPTKRGNYTLLDSLIAERAPKICVKHPNREGIPVDIRCIEFGKGKGYLADDFRKSPPTGRVFARSGELADAVIEVLIPLAQEVHIKTR